MRLSAVVVLSCAVACLTAQNLQPRLPTKMLLPSELLERAAGFATTNDSTSIKVLGEAVVNYPHRFNMPSVAGHLMKSRGINSELSFRQGSHRGIDEKDIVDLINSLADQFNLPDYARTSAKQVRVLRMQAFIINPIFLGRGMAEQRMEVGQQITTTLSPLQAIHIVQTLIDQKFYNPAYQVPPSEWDSSGFQQELSRIGSTNQEARIHVRVNPKRRELEDRLSEHLATMSDLEALTTFNDVLSKLGLY